MNTLDTTIQKLFIKTGFDKHPDFVNTEDIVYNYDWKNHLHTFNYLLQEFPWWTYRETDPACEAFNTAFADNDDDILTQLHRERLRSNGFTLYNSTEDLQQFDNDRLEMDFFPGIKGYYIKNDKDNHYMLVSFEKYDSEEFTWLTLLKYAQPYFWFPHQDNYIPKL